MMVMMMANAIRKSRGLILLIGQYEVRFANDDHGNGDDDVDDDDNGHSCAEELSRVLIQRIVDGLLTLIEYDDGR